MDGVMKIIIQNQHLYSLSLSVFKWLETDGLISKRRDWFIGFKYSWFSNGPPLGSPYTHTTINMLNILRA